MIKQFFKISLYSFITFCVLNFTALLFQIYVRLQIKEIPEINIGFPFNFYSVFWLDGNDLHHGADFKNLIYDILIFWIIVFLYFQLKTRNFRLTTNNKQQT
jgi:hypothetical protein